MTNIIELNHGELNVKLLVCTKSWRQTILSLEADTLATSMTTLASAEVLFRYAYYSYLAYCKKNLQTPSYDEFDFDELLTGQEVEKGKSNIEEVLSALSESVISKFQGVEGEGEEVKKK